MLFIYGSGRQRIDNNKKCRQIAGNLDCHADVAVQPGAHHPMEHIPGFNRRHWMPSSVEYSHPIAVAAAMVYDFG
jgi:hypothetical protein